MRKPEEGIDANQEAKRGRWQLIVEMEQGGYHVRSALAVNLTRIIVKRRLITNGQFNHGNSIFHGGNRLSAVDRLITGDDVDSRELQGFKQFNAHTQMANVDGIKRTA